MEDIGFSNGNSDVMIVVSQGKLFVVENQLGYVVATFEDADKEKLFVEKFREFNGFERGGCVSDGKVRNRD